MKIAIDGPAGAGKSTIARKLAVKLGYLYIDSGAMYRALTLEALSQGINLNDEDQIYQLAASLDLQLEPDVCGAKNYVYVNNKDVTPEIRKPEVSEHVSLVASYSKVREIMVKKQQKIACLGSVVMDGRDIGTVVMPDADLKIFLQASVGERAKRRSLELLRQGYKVDLAKLEEQIKKRDCLDSSREISPLLKAEDAVELDTTKLTVAEVVDIILTMLTRRKANV